MREAAAMPKKTAPTRGKGKALTPEQVKDHARTYADRLVKMRRKHADRPEQFWSQHWTDLYIQRWRSLSGLSHRTVVGPERRAGTEAKAVAEEAKVVPIRRRRKTA